MYYATFLNPVRSKNILLFGSEFVPITKCEERAFRIVGAQFVQAIDQKQTSPQIQLYRDVVLKVPIRTDQLNNTVFPHLVIRRVGISNYAWLLGASKRFPVSSFEGRVTHIKEG